mgnify:FL=1|jgi:negative regulator of sigma E activity
MRNFFLCALLLTLLTQPGFVLENSLFQAAQSGRDELVSSKRPVDGPWPEYLPPGYKFQGFSYLKTKKSKITYLRFANGEKLLSLFIDPNDESGHNRRHDHPDEKKKGDYTIFEWKKGGDKYTLIGRESLSVLKKIAKSVK